MQHNFPLLKYGLHTVWLLSKERNTEKDEKKRLTYIGETWHFFSQVDQDHHKQ
jgi:hypothetical protein